MSESSLSAKSSLDSLREGSPAPSVGSVPDLLAPAVAGPMVWEGAGLKDYIVCLDESEIQNIRAAVIHHKCKCPF